MPTDQPLQDSSGERDWPAIIGLCPEHREEFYVPHAGPCPECGRVLVEYVPAEQLAGAVEALREVERICAVAGGERSSSPVVTQITKAARSGLWGSSEMPSRESSGP